MKTYRINFLTLRNYYKRLRLITAAVAASVVLIVPAVSLAAGSSTQFVDPNPEAGDEFGYALSLSTDGNIAVVGSPNSTVGDNSLEGTAYIFTNSGGNWTEVAQLAPSDGDQYDRFGSSVSITPDGSKVIVGALYSPPSGTPSTHTGHAYIFNEPAAGWSGSIGQSAELAGSDTQNTDFFGTSVSLSADGSSAIVGAKQANQSLGEAYVFTEPDGDWSGTPTETTMLAPSNAAPYKFFGWSVSLSADGSTAIVGAPGDNTMAGSVYQFTKPVDGWPAGTESSSATLNSQDGAAGDLFGLSVDLTSDGQTIIVGAPAHTTNGNQFAGAAYIFGNGGGSLTQMSELTAPDSVASDLAGYSVAIASDGSSALIGAPAKKVNGHNSEGAAYQFNQDGNGAWLMNNELTPTTDGDNQNFGWSGFIVSNQAEGNAFVGAPGLSAPGAQAASPSQKAKALQNVLLQSDVNPGGSGNGTAYDIDLSPTISNFTPTKAGMGVPVKITGTRFSGATSVSFNGVPAASFTVDSASQITAIVPSTSATGFITVTTPNGTATSSAQFTSLAPTITNPGPASEGNKLTIKGTNLAGATSVTLNGQALTITKNSKSAISVSLPLNAVSGTLVVNTPSGTAQSPLTILAPTITSFTATAKIGATVAIHGANLAGVTQVEFNGVATSPVSATGSVVKVIVPAGTTNGPLTVVAASGQATSSGSFTVKH